MWDLGCQNLRYSLVSLDTFDVVQEGRVPLLKGVTVKWIGISEDGVSMVFIPQRLLLTSAFPSGPCPLRLPRRPLRA